MVFNATFNNISVILWSDLLVEETGENHWSATSHRQTLSHNVVSSKPHLNWFITKLADACYILAWFCNLEVLGRDFWLNFNKKNTYFMKQIYIHKYCCFSLKTKVLFTFLKQTQLLHSIIIYQYTTCKNMHNSIE